jgi:hypothetical protein
MSTNLQVPFSIFRSEYFIGQGFWRPQYYPQLLPRDTIMVIDKFLQNPIPELDFQCDDVYRTKVSIDNKTTMLIVKDIHITDRTWGGSITKFDEVISVRIFQEFSSGLAMLMLLWLRMILPTKNLWMISW